MKTIFAIILMCFTGFAFAEGDVMEGSKKAREEGSVPDTSVYGEEGGMAPPGGMEPPDGYMEPPLLGADEGEGGTPSDEGVGAMEPSRGEGPIIEEID